jgi:hypothetical protein
MSHQRTSRDLRDLTIKRGRILRVVMRGILGDAATVERAILELATAGPPVLPSKVSYVE